jgi:hypothetical protein
LSLIETEKESFRAFVDYVLANPFYARILLEAETMALAAHLANSELVLAQHSRRLMEGWKRGELPHYKQSEILALSTLLLNLRRDFVRARLDNNALKQPAEPLIGVCLRVIASAMTPPVEGPYH